MIFRSSYFLTFHLPQEKTAATYLLHFTTARLNENARLSTLFPSLNMANSLEQLKATGTVRPLPRQTPHCVKFWKPRALDGVVIPSLRTFAITLIFADHLFIIRLLSVTLVSYIRTRRCVSEHC